MLSSRTTLAALVIVAGLALTGCAATAPVGEAAAPQQEQAPQGDFCAEFEANGGGGASIRPVAIFYAKDALLEDVTGQLAAMGDVTPPEEIAADWTAHKTYLTALLPLVEALPTDGMLSAASEAMPEDPASYQAIVDYYFDRC